MNNKKPWYLTLVLTCCTVCASTTLAGPPDRSLVSGRVNVMTQNLYVGADLFKILEAQVPEEIPLKVTEIFLDIQATDFEDRAGAIAELVAKQDPHLIGLQEVSNIFVQCPGDAVVGNPNPAEELYADYLTLLLDALEARGLDYSVGAEVTNADVEVPAVAYDPSTGAPVLEGCTPPAAAPFIDVRLVDRDVILVRSDVDYSSPLGMNFTINLTVPTEAGPVEFTRGWTALDASVNGRTFTFFNTHLEVSGSPFARAVQFAQASELITVLGTLDTTIIAVGDFNSSAADGAFVECATPGQNPGDPPVFFPCPTPYEVLSLNGYVDTWNQRGGPWDAGFTCCQDDLLDNEDSAHDERIDLIWVRPAAGHYGGPVARGVTAGTLGDRPEDKSAGGLWPSDHAGVGARMTIRVPR
ncbi:MAG: hypothetical protein PVH13_00865 [Gammaproteobacteria bacterium]|jgi:hypothetical protein